MSWDHTALHPLLPYLAAGLIVGCIPARAENAPVVSSVEQLSLHAQTTVIEQWHGDFTSPYSGLNSLTGGREDQHTFTLTAFLDRRLWTGAELCYDPEVSQGNGLSSTVGVAGFPNGEATRAGAKSPEYHTARLFLRQTIGLGGETEKVDSDQNQAAGGRDVNRLTFTLGKLSASDQFDNNSYTHDPRTQFLNWALMSNGAWDYPADTKGYTGGFTVEWNRQTRAFRWGAFMEPVGANEGQLDQHLSKAVGQALEWEERYAVAGRSGTLRTLVYWNSAHMGSYDEATRLAVPDITQTRRYRSKTGLGLNWEQELADGLGAFARAGYNDGRTETWAFTEIDRTFSAGLSLKGARWGRPDDTLAAAVLINGLSPEHRRYLAAGGYGFIVGDGRLNYGAENIFETYYDLKPVAWLALAFDYQWVGHPGYNRDRGPVSIFALRAHLAL